MKPLWLLLLFAGLTVVGTTGADVSSSGEESVDVKEKKGREEGGQQMMVEVGASGAVEQTGKGGGKEEGEKGKGHEVAAGQEAGKTKTKGKGKHKTKGKGKGKGKHKKGAQKEKGKEKEQEGEEGKQHIQAKQHVHLKDQIKNFKIAKTDKDLDHLVAKIGQYSGLDLSDEANDSIRTMIKSFDDMKMEDMLDIGGRNISKAQLLTKQALMSRAMGHSLVHKDKKTGKIFLNHIKFMEECSGYMTDVVFDDKKDNKSRDKAALAGIKGLGLKLSAEQEKKLSAMVNAEDAGDAVGDTCQKIFGWVSTRKENRRKHRRKEREEKEKGKKQAASKAAGGEGEKGASHHSPGAGAGGAPEGDDSFLQKKGTENSDKQALQGAGSHTAPPTAAVSSPTVATA
uniref:Uncharacterized protein n=1 Tax=Chromera velia CCMP2878 TaxID=1169474 RepID=A0A0G4FBJ9_9ALVE|eukprot:Cvel_16180.t1-p1 / transcript=Cvel_16180.t1 / gene=Cvel_16180 / organism=Chromera_velia_CCMP2878 / gene_product=hypothetical protein / transcript_product=hypothetical protein / location=Cvel_scaffold1234:23404-25698(-) / protein_length=397 / sequence_SO=supercontig / SO=protein_coding / is_pseudo=false